MSKLKLYAIGSTTGDPSKWGKWDEFDLVLAENKEQAEKMSDGYGVHLVDMNGEAIHLAHVGSTWHMGADL